MTVKNEMNNPGAELRGISENFATDLADALVGGICPDQIHNLLEIIIIKF